MDIEEQFEILRAYKERQRAVVEHDDDPCPDAPPPSPNIDKCFHNHQVVNEGHFVCTVCGLVLDSVLLPEVNFTERCILPRLYAARERLTAVDRHLVRFMQKTGVLLNLHGVLEPLQYMKKESGYKSLNYAIALTCICAEHDEIFQKLQPYLPKSHVAWARSSKLMSCKPQQFSKAWLRQLLIRTKPLTPFQLKKFKQNIREFNSEEKELMQRLIQSYGCCEPRVELIPAETKCALYRFSSAMCRARKMMMKGTVAAV